MLPRVTFFIFLRDYPQGSIACGRRRVKIYYQSKVGNFGDKLNEDLMDYFSVAFTRRQARWADFAAIGSVLGCFIKHRKFHIPRVIKIFGSGFIMPPNIEQAHFIDNMEFYALRGKLSLECCEKMTGYDLSDIPLGDPGLLIKRFYPDITDTPKLYDVGIVQHFKDKESPLVNNIKLRNLTFKFIDILQPTKQFASEVASCRFILSSALHGLICADSLGIPNKHILFTENNGSSTYKYRDYYSVFSNVIYDPVILPHNTITDEDIAKFTAQYNIAPEDVDKIIDALEAAFPYKS